MKRFIQVIAGLLIGFVGSFFAFFFYAKRPTLREHDYYKQVETGFVYREPKDTLSLVTYNIGYLSGMTNNLPTDRNSKLFDDNLASAIELFDKLDPDIVGLQEIDFGSKRSYGRNQLDSLAMGLSFPIFYKAVNWDKAYLPFPYWPPKYHFGKMLSGQAVFSRFPIDVASTEVLERPKSSFFYNAFYIDRLAQIMDVKVGSSRTVKLINVHLEAFDETSRVVQAKRVREIYESFADDMPVIMMGDFNSVPEYERGENGAMKVIMGAEGIKSAIDEQRYEEGGVFTFNSESPYQMIDYILYNQKYFRLVEANVVHEAGQISDHLPVKATLAFRE